VIIFLQYVHILGLFKKPLLPERRLSIYLRVKAITFNKLTSVFYASVLLLIMNFVITLTIAECNLVPRALSPPSRGRERTLGTRLSRVDPQTTLTMLWRNSLSITEDIKKWHQFVFNDNRLSNFPLSFAYASHEFHIHVSFCILTIKLSLWARVNFCSYRKIIGGRIYLYSPFKGILPGGRGVIYPTLCRKKNS